MKVIELTHENFDEVTDRPGIILIDFWAEWCAPCKAFAPLYEEAAAQYPQVLFGKVNTDLEPTLARQFEVRSIPTLLGVKDGGIAAIRVGTLSPTQLAKWIQELMT